MVEVELEQKEQAERVTWLSRVCGRAEFRAGDVVSIEVSQDKEHWFDAESGERIERRQNLNNPTT
jgi:hypothetical protein